MKLEVGMYVRTKRRTLQPPQIARITNMSKDVVLNQYFIELDKNLIPSYKYHIYEEDILKASHSLLGDDKEDGIIEVGDYVNGYKIYSIYNNDEYVNEYNPKHKKCLSKNIYDEDYQEYLIYEEDIETIVTKEQFESMQYEVKDV